jgi:hypothetical protein
MDMSKYFGEMDLDKDKAQPTAIETMMKTPKRRAYNITLDWNDVEISLGLLKDGMEKWYNSMLFGDLAVDINYDWQRFIMGIKGSSGNYIKLLANH